MVSKSDSSSFLLYIYIAPIQLETQANDRMSNSSEYQKHVRRRLEPIRMAVRPRLVGSGPRPTGSGGDRTTATVVEAGGVRYRGLTLRDAGMDWSYGGQKAHLANRFVEECIQLSRLRHPNVAMLYGVAFDVDGTSLTLVTDLPSMTLDECLCRNTAVPEFTKISILLDASRGLLYLHSQRPPIAHRRFSTKSVFLFPSMRAKIGDVGVAGSLSERELLQSGAAQEQRLPPAPLVNCLEKGAAHDHPRVDIPAFGNVIVHTVNQQRWISPAGQVLPVPCLQKMTEHPLYPLASLCLQNSGQCFSQVDINYVVQSLAQAILTNPQPFDNVLEMYQSMKKMKERIKTYQDELSSLSSNSKDSTKLQEILHCSQQEITRLEKELVTVRGMVSSQKSIIQNLKAQVELFKVECNETPSSQKNLPYDSDSSVATREDGARKLSAVSLSTSNTSSPPRATSPNVGNQDPSSPAFSLNLANAVITTPEHFSPQHTPEIKASPPKPPQRSSSFRKKRAQKRDLLFTDHIQQQSLTLKPVNTKFDGQTASNSLLLPSKYASSTPKDSLTDVQQTSRSQQSMGNVSSNTALPLQLIPKSSPFDSANMEFQKLLARRREKVELHHSKSFSLPSPVVTAWDQQPNQEPITVCVNGTMNANRNASSESLQDPSTTVPEEGTKRIRGLPKPPTRTSSIKSRMKPKKYRSPNNVTSPPAESNDATTSRSSSPPPSVQNGQWTSLSPSPSTSPSTGQVKEPSVESQLLKRLAQQKEKANTNTPGMGIIQLEMQRLEKQKKLSQS